MKKKTWFGCLVFVFFVLSNFWALNAKAQTVVAKKDDCHYQIKVSMVFDFKGQAIDYADTLLPYWQAGMDRVWNGNHGSKNFGSGCQVDYKFTLKQMADNQTCADFPYDHCFGVVFQSSNQRGNVADAAVVMANGQSNSFGEWTVTTTDLNAAHEVGHMMGLGEEYHYEMINGNKTWVSDNFRKTGPQSIMSKTWGDVTAFSSHTEQIMAMAGITPPAPGLCKITQPDLTPANFVKVNFYKGKAGQKIYSERVAPHLMTNQAIKGETDNAVYLVDESGQLRWLTNEQVAEKILGKNWSQQIIWFNDAIVYTYKIGVPIN